jgi:hypothetical protein
MALDDAAIRSGRMSNFAQGTRIVRINFARPETGNAIRDRGREACYHGCMFNFGKPKTAGDWVVHVAGGIVALFLVWWMLRVYVL